CVSRFARAAIGYHPDGIDSFRSGAGGDKHALASERFGLEEGDQFGKKLVWFQHAPAADFATSLFTFGRAEQMYSVLVEQSDIALCGRVQPHFPVHGRSNQQRAVAARYA